MYRYFISFQGKDGIFGNQEIQRDNKVTCIKDIQEIARDIELSYSFEHKSIAVMNFQLFEDKS